MNLINNVKWVSISQIVKILCQILGMFIFSRLLSPAEIGIMAMALVVVNFTNIFRDLGTSAAVIQQPTVTEILKKTIFTLNISFGIVVFFLVFLGAPLIASFFNEPLLINVLRLVAFSFPINSATAIHLSLLERDSKFSKIAIVEVGSSVFALFIAIIFSIKGAGVYSLVAQTLLYSIFSAFGFIFNSSWKIGFAFNYQEIKRVFSFTANLLGFNFLNFFSRNLDQVIIGKNFSAVILGHYSLAYRLMLFPIQNITFVLTRSLYPILSRLQDNSRESFKTYLHSLKAIAIIIPPLMAGIALVSKDFIYVFFGEKWLPVASILLWLAPVAVMQSFVSTTGSVFMSKGKTNILLVISIYNAILQIGAFIIGGFFDILILIKLYLIANLLMFIPNMYLAIRVLSGKLMDFFSVLIKPCFATGLMVLVVSFSQQYLPFKIESHLVNFILHVVLGGIVYTCMIFILEKDFFLKRKKCL